MRKAPVLLLMLGGCLRTEADPNHCLNMGGDIACPDAFCSRCTNVNNGCVGEVPEDLSCYASEDGQSTAADGGGSGAETDAETETETTASATCEGECGPIAPFCRDGACQPCEDLGGDAFCGSESSEGSVCYAGRCVECTDQNTDACGGEAPFCSDAFACAACDEHSDCPQSACDLINGVCFPEDRVWWVDTASCPGGFGFETDPFCTIEQGLNALSANGQIGVLKVRPGRYAERLFVSTASETRIAMVGVSGGVVLTGDGTDAALVEATPLDNFYVQGVRLEDAQGWAATCTGRSSLWLDDVKAQNNGGGVQVDRCQTTIRRSEIIFNAGDGVHGSGGATVSIRSSIVAANGDAAQTTAGLRIEDATLDMKFATIAGNLGQAGANLFCSGTAEATISDSVVVAEDTSAFVCNGANISTSAVSTEGLGDSNVVVKGIQDSWFAGADYRTAGESPFVDIAVWDLGDPLIDVDGAARSGVPGQPEVAGANIP